MQANKEETLNSISMHDFLDFLKLTCQVHQSITVKDQSANETLDYNKLARNELVNSLINAKPPPLSSPKTIDGDHTNEAAAVLNSSIDKKGKGQLNFFLLRNKYSIKYLKEMAVFKNEERVITAENQRICLVMTSLR